MHAEASLSVGRLTECPKPLTQLACDVQIDTCFSGSEVGCFSEGSSAIDVKTSNLESIACKGLKSSGSEVPIGCDFRNHTPSWFVELDCVSSNLPIALSACYGVPHHSDVSGAYQQSPHIPWSSRWSCRKKAITTYTHT